MSDSRTKENVHTKNADSHRNHKTSQTEEQNFFSDDLNASLLESLFEELSKESLTEVTETESLAEEPLVSKPKSSKKSTSKNNTSKNRSPEEAAPKQIEQTKQMKPVKRKTISEQSTKVMEPVKRSSTVSTTSTPRKKAKATNSSAPVKKSGASQAAPARKAVSQTAPARSKKSGTANASSGRKVSTARVPSESSRNVPAKRRLSKSSIQKRRKRKIKHFLRLLIFLTLFLLSLGVLKFSIQFLSRSIHSAKTVEAVSPADAVEAQASPLEEKADFISNETENIDAETNADSETEATETVSVPTSTSITISVCGDCTLGNEETFGYENSLGQYWDNYGASYFLQNVRSIFEADDLTIANLECSFTEATTRSDHIYCFKAPASYTDILLDGSVEAVNLANNHTFDFLEQGYNDTRAALDAASIVHFGYEETAVMDVKGIKVGLVGTYEMIEGTGIETQLKANIEKVKADGAQIVIVIFHWGNELDLVPNYNQLYLAHKAVDFGADLVCGGHAHVLQGIENYKGKNILYGMANFCFGGNVYPRDMDTIIYQQTFTVDENGLADDLVTNIIPCSTSSAEGYNNYQPTVATGEDAQRILNKLEERTASIPEYSE